MNKDIARSLFMDYLYDELNDEKKKELEQFLSKHPDLRQELDELSDVRSMLAHLPVQDPAEQLVMLEPNRQSFSAWWNGFKKAVIPQNTFARTGLALAACLLLFVVTGAFTKMNITVENGSFNLAFGEPQVQQGYTPEQVNYIVTQLREENAQLINQVVEDAQQEQEQRIAATLVDFANYMEDQRTSDLKLISTGINSLEETYYDRFRHTDQVLGEIIQTVSQNN